MEKYGKTTLPQLEALLPRNSPFSVLQTECPNLLKRAEQPPPPLEASALENPTSSCAILFANMKMVDDSKKDGQDNKCRRVSFSTTLKSTKIKHQFQSLNINMRVLYHQ